jgi:glucose-6-phosphate 1-dehydrogenase
MQSKPSSIIIFGAKGDLTHRKLIPALFNLYLHKHLQQQFHIFCVDYITIDETIFKNDLLNGINTFSRSGKATDEDWKNFAANITYLQGDFLKITTFDTLKQQLDAFDKANKIRGVRLFYFAVAPRFIEIIADALYKTNACNQNRLDRIVVEKPFGTDLETAQKLNKFLRKRFIEQQVYRIDHYLGKETVQNILAFRFANYVFEPLWNCHFIDHVQISVAEQVSVGKRGGYYDQSGALKDMIQNHLLQLLCVAAMECPHAYQPEAVRNAKNDVLKSIRIYNPAQVFKNVTRAQYVTGTVNGIAQQAYKKEEQVASGSTTETYVAAKLFIDNKRWKGVPFFLRTGKCIAKQSSVIVIQFKDSPHKIFKDDILPNRLVISIQPELEISLLFESKVPGIAMKLKPVEMDFTYQDNYTETIPEAYETLLLDALKGDATLFMRADQVENSWKVVMPILKAWKKYPKKELHTYKAGSWGPAAALKLLKPFAKDWILLPTDNVDTKETQVK